MFSGSDSLVTDEVLVTIDQLEDVYEVKWSGFEGE